MRWRHLSRRIERGERLTAGGARLLVHRRRPSRRIERGRIEHGQRLAAGGATAARNWRWSPAGAAGGIRVSPRRTAHRRERCCLDELHDQQPLTPVRALRALSRWL